MTTKAKEMLFGFEASYELYNARGERLRSALLRENPGSGQVLQLDIVNVLADKPITLKRRTTVGTTEGKYHFLLRFGRGALADREAGVVGEDWHIKKETKDGGDTLLYLAWKSPTVTLAPGDRLVVQLHGVSAGPSSGAAVPMTLSWPLPDTEGDPDALLSTGRAPGEGGYTLQHNITLAVQDRRGRRDIPLRAYFVGPNQVLNVDNERSSLTLRLVNSAPPGSQETLRFRYSGSQTAPSSSLVVALPVGTVTARPWALGTKDDVNGAKISIERNWAPSGDSMEADGGNKLEWKLTPTKDVELKPGEYFDVSLRDLTTGHPSGPAELELRYSGVPGYWDGEILCTIEKAPLVFGRDAAKANIQIGGEIQHRRELVFRSDADNGGEGGALRFFNKTTRLMEVSSDEGFQVHTGDSSFMEVSSHGGFRVTNGASLFMELSPSGDFKVNRESSSLHGESSTLIEVSADGRLKLKSSDYIQMATFKNRSNVHYDVSAKTSYNIKDWFGIIVNANFGPNQMPIWAHHPVPDPLPKFVLNAGKPDYYIYINAGGGYFEFAFTVLFIRRDFFQVGQCACPDGSARSLPARRSFAF